jgi:hypothetical protein
MLHARGKHEVVMVFSALAALLLGPGIRSASAETTVRVLEDTPVSPVADIPADVRKECTGLGDELPRAIARANPRVTMVRTPQELRAGKHLTIEIIQVKARAAGALTGPKKMTVRGRLVDDGKQVADFEAERGAMEAAGTCRTLQKAEKDLGNDIGNWLMSPRPHSRLGDI